MEVRDHPGAGVPPPLDEGDRRIVAYRVRDTAPPLRVAGPHREWMDATPDRFAYRCLPLVIANQLGWDLINPARFRARWLGGEAPADVQIEWLDGESDSRRWASAHFGSGVLTFNTGYVFRTPPGAGLLVGGPPNTPKDGLHALTGFVEADWNDTTFTMNYLFTRPDHWVTFEAGEPFCRLTPISVDPIEALAPQVAPIEAAPDLAERYHAWSAERDRFNRELTNPWSDEARVGWSKEYFQGKRVDGAEGRTHRTQLCLRPFVGAAPDAPTERKARPARPTAAKKKTRADASRCLWSDTDCFATRQQKHAEVLVGVAKTLRRRRPLDGGEKEFLDAFDRFCEMDVTVVTEILYEPTAYFWTRMAFQFIDACLNGAEPTPLATDYREALGATTDREALARHLERFRLFELGATLAAGENARFDRSLTLDLPVAIPASDLQLVGEGSVELLGVRDGGVLVRSGDRVFALEGGMSASDSLRCERAPTVRHAGSELRLQPLALDGLGIAAVETAVAAGTDYQARHGDLIRRALASIERHSPEVFEQISGATRVVGLKPDAAGDYGNVSFSELPGAMLLSVFDNPLVMADRIVHEFHHNRLFHIEDSGALLDPEGDRRAAFYSPWRDDPRPLLGVLHGLYVFLAVGRYWLSLWRSEDEHAAQHDVIADHALRTVLQLRLAEQTLVEHARFTPPGEGLFAQLRSDVERLEADVRSANVPGNTPAIEVAGDGVVSLQRDRRGASMTVPEAVAAHYRRFATR